MTYADWDKNLKDIIKFRTKNFTMSVFEMDLVIDMVYREILSYANLTLLYEKVSPRGPNSREYHLHCGDTAILPIAYKDAQIIQVVDAVCLDGRNYMRFLSEAHRLLYILDDRVLLPEGYEYTDSGCSPEYRLGKDIIFTWKCIPDKKLCKKWVLEEIYTAMVEGINYQIISTVPATIDSQLANLQYQRFTAEKEKLLNAYPVNPRVNVMKLQWNIECAPIGEDFCGCITPCEPVVTADPLDLYTADNKRFNVSCKVHGACGEDVTDIPCCNFIPFGATGLLTSLYNKVKSSCTYHGQCNGTNPGIPVDKCVKIIPRYSDSLIDREYRMVFGSGGHGTCKSLIYGCEQLIPSGSSGFIDKENKTVYISQVHGSCIYSGPVAECTAIIPNNSTALITRLDGKVYGSGSHGSCGNSIVIPIPPVAPPIDPGVNLMLTIRGSVLIDTNGYRILLI